MAVFTIAEGVVRIDGDTDAAKKKFDGFFRDVNGDLHRANGHWASAGEKAAFSFFEGLDRGVERRGGFFGRMFQGIRSGVSSGIGNLRELGSTLRDVGQVFSTAGGFMGSALKFGALAAAVPIVVGLAAALSKLIGLMALLPGVIGFAVAAIAPLVVAFQGVGDAIGALVSGDMDKLNEALKKLAPSARSFVREFGQILPILRRIKMDTQQAFFAPLLGGLKELGKFTLPTIRAGMVTVSGALGRMVRGFMDLFAANDIVEAIGDIFESTGRIIDRVGPSLIKLVGTLVGVAEHGLPFVERMFGNMADGMERFADFLGDAMADGRLEGWLNSAFSVMSDLWELTKSLGRLFAAIFGPTADEGQTFIQGLTIMVDKLTAFFRSDEGIEFLENLVALLRESKSWLSGIAATLIFLMEANNKFIDGIAATVQWFRNLDDVIGGWLSGAGAAISGWWDTAVTKIGELGTALVTFVTEKAAAFGQWLLDLPAMIYNGLVRAAETIGFLVGNLVGTAVANILSLPERARVGFDMFKQRAAESAAAVAQFFIDLPPKIATALSNMWSTVTGWFTRTKDSAVSNTRSMSDQVFAWVKGLGPRIMSAVSGAGHWLVSAGQDMVRGLMNGIQSMGNWIIDRVVGFGKSVVSGFKRGLGIASPSKVMRDQVGKWIVPGIVEGMQASMGSLDSFMGDMQRRMTQPLVNVAAPSVAVGGTTVLVDLGDGVQRALRTVVARNPRLVAAGTDEGRRQRGRELGARTKA